jgi:hypothetical protein
MFLVVFERSVPDSEGWQHVTVYAGTGLFSTEGAAMAAITHVFGREPIQSHRWVPKGQPAEPIPGRFHNGHHYQATVSQVTVDVVPDLAPDPIDRGCGTQNCY